MEINSHTINGKTVAEVLSDKLVIETTQDGLNLMGDLYYQGFESIILHEKNITPDFFDLKTGMAGEILQKFSTYRIRLVIVGNFRSYTSKSLKDFMYESNTGKHVNFTNTIEEALNKLTA